jgi:hypothetical protein
VMENQHREIAGYRDLSRAEVDLMNELKELEGQVAAAVRRLDAAAVVGTDDAVGRWAALARTHLETGFMFAVKAVARPTNGLGRR